MQNCIRARAQKTDLLFREGRCEIGTRARERERILTKRQTRNDRVAHCADLIRSYCVLCNSYSAAGAAAEETIAHAAPRRARARVTWK